MHDVCVVGSGFAATFLGLRLVEQGVSAVFVEAGGDLTAADPLEGRVDLFPHSIRSGEEFSVDFNRSIAVGGTSRKWNGVVSRLAPNDFRSWSEFGLFADWPISYDDVRGYYDAAERRLATEGGAYRAGCEPPRDAPYPVVWPSQRDRLASSPDTADLGFYPLAFSSRRPQSGPLRLHDVELPRFRASSLGTLIENRPVTRVVAGNGATITHVEARRPDGQVEHVTGRFFVLANGVFEAARLLLVSGRGAPDAFGNRCDLVGRYFHAHPRLRILVPRRHERLGLEGVWRSHAFGDALRRNGAGAICADLNFWGPDVAVDLTLETEPSATNRVVLDPSQHDARGCPLAILEYDRTDLDSRTLARAARLHADLVAVVAGRDFTAPEPSLTWFHPAGTCRMARSASDGVVDPDCRVFGTENLFVAGAAVFPSSGAGNPTLTVVALALRLADHLVGRLRGSPST